MESVFVSGSFDLTHSGHITFLKEASRYGDLYVGIGSDQSLERYKEKKPIYPQEERLYIISAIRYVKEAWINSGEGPMDFITDFFENDFWPDILVVNEDQDHPAKAMFCLKHKIKYIVLKRKTEPQLPVRSSTNLKELWK
jgi:cytidyltransferase-like protein